MAQLQTRSLCHWSALPHVQGGSPGPLPCLTQTWHGELWTREDSLTGQVRLTGQDTPPNAFIKENDEAKPNIPEGGCRPFPVATLTMVPARSMGPGAARGFAPRNAYPDSCPCA